MKSVSTEVCEVHISADVCHIFCEWASVCVFVFDDALLSASLECVCSCQGVEEMQVWLSVGIHVSVCVCVNRESGMCLCVSVRQARDQNSLIWMQWGFLRSNRRQRERETQFAFMFCNIYLDFITGNCFSNTNTLVMITKPFNIYFWRVWQRNGKLKLMQM